MIIWRIDLLNTKYIIILEALIFYPIARIKYERVKHIGAPSKLFVGLTLILTVFLFYLHYLTYSYDIIGELLSKYGDYLK